MTHLSQFFYDTKNLNRHIYLTLGSLLKPNDSNITFGKVKIKRVSTTKNYKLVH